MTNKIYPFKFLDSYTADDQEIFFGRDEEIEQLYQMIFQSDILLLYGASGTGKTSLIQCGLAGRFQKHDWLEIFVRRHSNINESLLKALKANGGEAKQETKNKENKEEDLDWLNNLMDDDDSSPTPTKNLSPIAQSIRNIYLKHFRPIYLIFDQFEELFILGNKEEQEEFIASIRAILQVEQPVKLIFSIREEYLGSLYEFEKVVPQLLRKKLRIDPMNLEKVRNVILGATACPKSIVHVNKEEQEEIAEQIFEKVRGEKKTLTIELPYLQVFLDKLYRDISNDKEPNPTTEATLNLADLAESGDIDNILRDFLVERINEITQELSLGSKTIWKILSHFVTSDNTKEPIGLDALALALPAINFLLIKKIVTALMNNRILRYLENEDLYEIAHDSLALRIAENRSDKDIELAEVRNLIKNQSALKGAAQELFTKKQLAFIEPYLNQIELSSEQELLIQKSKEKIQADILRQQEAEDRERKRIQDAEDRERIRIQKEKDKARKVKISAFLIVAVAIVIAIFIYLNSKNKDFYLDRIINAFEFYADNFALAKVDNKFGFIDKEGNFVIENNYELAYPFDIYTDFAVVKLPKKDSLFLLNTAGKQFNMFSSLGEIKENVAVGSIFHDGTVKYGAEETALTNFPAEEIFKHTATLKVLALYNCSFEKIPSKINQLKNLRLLNLEKCSLVKSLPSTIGELKKLRYLSLKDTDLDTLPSSIGELKELLYLNLSGTKIKSLPNSILQLKNLETLVLPSSIQKLPKLKGLINLKKLYFEVESYKTTEKRTRTSQFTGDADLIKYGRDLYTPHNIINVFNTPFLKNQDLIQSQSISDSILEQFLDSIAYNKSLEELYFPINQNNLSTKAIKKLEKLEKLNLGYINFSALDSLIVLPDNVCKLSFFNDLSKMPSNLVSLPKCICESGGIKEQTEINLSYLTSLKSLPESFGKLSKLQILQLPLCLEQLPASFSELEALRKIQFGGFSKRYTSHLDFHISEDSINLILQKITTLEMLTHLDVSNLSHLTELPNSIGNLKHLEELYLPEHLEELPSSFKNLVALTKIQFQENGYDYHRKASSRSKQESLLKRIDDLKNLRYLDISCLTKLERLPSDFGHLTNLKILKLPASLTSLPNDIGNFKDLKVLNLSHLQRLKKLPTSLENIPSFRLEHCPRSLEELPDFIFDRPINEIRGNLNEQSRKELDLSFFYNLRSLPDSIGKLKQLEKLTLQRLNIKKLPESIGNLSQLKELVLYQLPIKKLPSSIGNLTNLRVLNLQHTKITSLPNSIVNLVNLKNLDVGVTQIQFLPDSIGKLTNLTRLNVGTTPLRKLPESIGELTQLKTLHLDNTPRLTTLPSSILKIKKLETLTSDLKGKKDEAFKEYITKIDPQTRTVEKAPDSSQ